MATTLLSLFLCLYILLEQKDRHMALALFLTVSSTFILLMIYLIFSFYYLKINFFIVDH